MIARMQSKSQIKKAAFFRMLNPNLAIIDLFNFNFSLS